MRLVQAVSISALCFLTRTTCMPLQNFDEGVGQASSYADSARQENNQDAFTNRARQNAQHEHFFDEQQKLHDYLLEQTQRCLATSPPDHGILLHIAEEPEYTLKMPSSPASVQRPTSPEKRLGGKVRQTWKSMPTDQRIQSVGTLAGALCVPAYLVSSAQGWVDYQITNIKKNAAQRGGKAPPPPPIRHHAVVPSIPPVRGHRARSLNLSGDDVHITIDYLSDNDGRGGDGNAFHDRGMSVKSVSKAASSGKLHSHASTSLVEHGMKQPKQPNATVGRALAWTGTVSSVLYVPAAMTAFWRAKNVSDDDLKKFRRQVSIDIEPGMPIVTCVPIAKQGPEDYVIPRDGLAPLKVDDVPISDFIARQESHFTKREAIPGPSGGSKMLTKYGKGFKLAGLATIGGAMGYIMHRMGQRRSLDEVDGSESPDHLLLKRDTTQSPNEVSIVRRWRPGKGSIFFGSILAGGALSRAGLGSPKLHATLAEEEAGKGKRSLSEPEPSGFALGIAMLERRRMGPIMKQIGRGANDKVALAVGTMATTFIAAKSGLLGKLTGFVKNPPKKQDSPPPAKRSLITETGDDIEAPPERRMGMLGKFLLAGTAAAGALGVAMHLKKPKTPPPVKRSLTSDVDIEGEISVQRRMGMLGKFLLAGTAAAGALGVAMHLKKPKTPPPAKRSLISEVDLDDEISIQRRFGKLAAAMMGGVGALGAVHIFKKVTKSPKAETPVKRSLSLEVAEDENTSLERRLGKVGAILMSGFGGLFIAQHTGKSGQKAENKQYKEQFGMKRSLAQEAEDYRQTSPLIRRYLEDVGSPTARLERREPNNNLAIVPYKAPLVKPSVKPSGKPSAGKLAGIVAGAAAATAAVTFGAKAIYNKVKGKKKEEPVPQKRSLEDYEAVAWEWRGQGGNVLDRRGLNPHLRAKAKVRVLSPSPSRGRSRLRGEASMSRHASSRFSRSPSFDSSVGSFNPEQAHNKLPTPNKVKEVHHFHHETLPEAHDAAAHAVPPKKGGGKGKIIAGVAGGAAIGAVGHAAYIQHKTAQEQAQADAALAEPVDPAAAPVARRKRDLGESGDIPLQKRQHSSPEPPKHTVLHKHHFHHHVSPDGHHQAHPDGHAPSALAKVKPGGGGGGAKKVIGGLVAGVAAGVLGHAIYSHVKANVPPPEAAPVDPAMDPAAPMRKRSNSYIERTLARQDLALQKRGKIATGIFGALVGTTGAATLYSWQHGKAGTRKQHTLPAGSLSGEAPPAKRSLVESSVRLDSFPMTGQRRGFLSKIVSKIPKFLKGGKAKGAMAIGAGLGVSGAAAAMEPKAAEAKKPMRRRSDAATALDLFEESMVKRGGGAGAMLKWVKNLKGGRRDAFVVAGIAGTAGAVGMMRRGAPDEIQGTQRLQKRILLETQSVNSGRQDDLVRRALGQIPSQVTLQARIPPPKVTFENKVGKMMDIGSIALTAGALVGNIALKVKDRFTSKGTKGAAGMTGGNSAGRSAKKMAKRSIAVVPDRETSSVHLAKREPAPGLLSKLSGIGMVASLIPMAVSAGKGIAKKIKHRRDIDLQEDARLIRRSLHEQDEVLILSQKRAPTPGLFSKLSGLGTIASLLPMAASAGKSIIGKIKHRRDIDPQGEAMLIRREIHEHEEASTLLHKRAPEPGLFSKLKKFGGKAGGAFGAISTAATLIPLAGSLGKGIANKIKGKRELTSAMEDHLLRRDVYDQESETTCLEKRDPYPGLLDSFTTAAMLGPMALGVAKAAGGKIKTLIKGKKVKCTLGEEAEDQFVRRGYSLKTETSSASIKRAGIGKKMTTVGGMGLLSAASFATMFGGPVLSAVKSGVDKLRGGGSKPARKRDLSDQASQQTVGLTFEERSLNAGQPDYDEYLKALQKNAGEGHAGHVHLARRDVVSSDLNPPSVKTSIAKTFGVQPPDAIINSDKPSGPPQADVVNPTNDTSSVLAVKDVALNSERHVDLACRSELHKITYDAGPNGAHFVAVVTPQEQTSSKPTPDSTKSIESASPAVPDKFAEQPATDGSPPPRRRADPPKSADTSSEGTGSGNTSSTTVTEGGDERGKDKSQASTSDPSSVAPAHDAGRRIVGTRSWTRKDGTTVIVNIMPPKPPSKE